MAIRIGDVNSWATLKYYIETAYDVRLASVIKLHAATNMVVSDAIKHEFSEFLESIPSRGNWYWTNRWLYGEGFTDNGVFAATASMLKGLATMELRSRSQGAKPFEQDPGWTLWCTNHLRMLSDRAVPTGTLAKALKDCEQYSREQWPVRKQRATKEWEETEAKRKAKVDTGKLKTLLNLLPDRYIDVIWKYRCSSPSMLWLREDLKHYSTRVREEFMVRAWVDHSNILRKLDAVRGSHGDRIPDVLQQRILAMVHPSCETLTVRQARVDTRTELKRQLDEVASQAGLRSLADTRASLKRIYDSITVDETVDKKARL